MSIFPVPLTLMSFTRIFRLDITKPNSVWYLNSIQLSLKVTYKDRGHRLRFLFLPFFYINRKKLYLSKNVVRKSPCFMALFSEFLLGVHIRAQSVP